jgi:hypothetical protein
MAHESKAGSLFSNQLFYTPSTAINPSGSVSLWRNWRKRPTSKPFTNTVSAGPDMLCIPHTLRLTWTLSNLAIFVTQHRLTKQQDISNRRSFTHLTQ